jgi:hypothetical protein
MKKFITGLTLIAALAFSAASFAADSPTTTSATTTTSAPAKGAGKGQAPAGNGGLAAHLAQLQDRASKFSARCAAHPNPKCTERKATILSKLNDFDSKVAARIASTTDAKKLAKLNEVKTAVDSLISSLG